MSKKILVLSTIYPSPDIKITNNTNVVHYFTREWVKLGYQVYVVHNYPIYLKILHWISSRVDKLIASKFNTSVTSVYINRDYEYQLDGVKIIRMPLFKPFPRYKVPISILNKQVKKIADFCKKENFYPDFITAHNFYPHIEMVNALKELYFNKAKTCIIVHNQNLRMFKYIKGEYKEQIIKVDIWGYRSFRLKDNFENFSKMKLNYFMCYSGIPPQFIDHSNIRKMKKPINDFIYVGSFIKRKYPEKILLAINKSNINKFHLTYVGDGTRKDMIKKIVQRKHSRKDVTFLGYVAREDIPNILAKSQCFIMISKEETFGLVYIEAMSMGCITIASRHEGMDGIIIDGENGFLCKAGDENELASILDKVNSLSNLELSRISNNAVQTASNLTDSKVAEDYINHLINLEKK